MLTGRPPASASRTIRSRSRAPEMTTGAPPSSVTSSGPRIATCTCPLSPNTSVPGAPRRAARRLGRDPPVPVRGRAPSSVCLHGRSTTDPTRQALCWLGSRTRGTSAQRAHSSAEEHPAYNRTATGSIPVAPTFFEFPFGSESSLLTARFESEKLFFRSGKRVKTMPRVAMQVGEPDEPETDLARVVQQLCGKWMPRKKTTCARKLGHAGDCATAENMENRRAYRSVHPHHQSTESRKRSKRKYRISSYGLTEASFAQTPVGAGLRLRHVSRAIQRGATHPRGPRPRVLQGQVPLVRKVRPRAPLPCLQHCARPH